MGEKDQCGATPLHLAAYSSNHPEIIELLLKHGADVNATIDHGFDSTPLHYAACGNRNPLILDALIRKGAEVDARANSRDLRLNSHSRSESMLLYEEMHRKSSKQKWSDNQGATPLHFAARYNEEPKVAELLLENGAKVDAEHGVFDNTPLLWAAFSNPNAGVIGMLIKNGAAVYETNWNRWTPLHYAAMNKSVYVLNELIFLDKDSDINFNGKTDRGKTALHFAAANENSEILLELISRGADVDARDEYGTTPLHEAAKNPNTAILQALISHDAEIDAKCGNGETPLHYAARYNLNPDAIHLLVQHGANTDAKDGHGATLLHYAASTENPEVVSAAIKYSPSGGYDAFDNFNRTPVHFVAGNENKEVIQAVFECVDDSFVREQDFNGQTALHYAAQNENAAAILIFLDNHFSIEIQDNQGNIASKYISWDSRLHGELDPKILADMWWDM